MVARLTKDAAGVGRPLVPANLLEPRRAGRSAAKSRAIAMPTPPSARRAGRRRNVAPAGNELDRLYACLETVTPENHPRTARLLRSSNRKMAQKVIEEAGEVALAAVKHNARGVVRESADLLYHLAVLWRRAGIDSADIWAEMHRRAENLGIAEKLPKAPRG